MHSPTFPDFQDLARGANVVPVYRQLLADTLTPVSAFQKLGGADHAFLLESVTGGERIGRYSFLGSEPSSLLRATGHQVEIVRVGVVGVPEALALRAAPRPARFEAGDGPFVERHGAQRAFAFGEQAIVHEEQHDKEQDRSSQPASRKRLAPEHEPRHYDADREYEQAQVRCNRSVARPDRRRFAAVAQAPGIFGLSSSLGVRCDPHRRRW